jgi:hypothetical protein
MVLRPRDDGRLHFAPSPPSSALVDGGGLPSIAEGQIAFHEDPMLDPGYVDYRRMAGVSRQWKFRGAVSAALRP